MKSRDYYGTIGPCSAFLLPRVQWGSVVHLKLGTRIREVVRVIRFRKV